LGTKRAFCLLPLLAFAYGFISLPLPFAFLLFIPGFRFISASLPCPPFLKAAVARN
jgi:hypothetical protein